MIEKNLSIRPHERQIFLNTIQSTICCPQQLLGRKICRCAELMEIIFHEITDVTQVDIADIAHVCIEKRIFENIGIHFSDRIC